MVLLAPGKCGVYVCGEETPSVQCLKVFELIKVLNEESYGIS